MDKCAKCGHFRNEHFPTKDCEDCKSYIGKCSQCSKCQKFVSEEDHVSAVQKANDEYHDRLSKDFTEYRITFGWNQPHGPYPKTIAYPGDPYGHYTTIFAPSLSHVYRIARERYDKQYAFVYAPDRWSLWGPEMGDIKELEKLEYWANTSCLPYPEPCLTHRDRLLVGGF